MELEIENRDLEIICIKWGRNRYWEYHVMEFVIGIKLESLCIWVDMQVDRKDAILVIFLFIGTDYGVLAATIGSGNLHEMESTRENS